MNSCWFKIFCFYKGSCLYNGSGRWSTSPSGCCTIHALSVFVLNKPVCLQFNSCYLKHVFLLKRCLSWIIGGNVQASQVAVPYMLSRLFETNLYTLLPLHLILLLKYFSYLSKTCLAYLKINNYFFSFQKFFLKLKKPPILHNLFYRQYFALHFSTK